MATERKGTETATRVADVLMLVTDGPDSLGVTAIARALGLSKTVVHRTLSSLVERGFLRWTGCRWRTIRSVLARSRSAFL